MKTKTTLTLFLSVLITSSLFSQSTIFPEGQVWNYYSAGNAPANDGQGDTWKQLDYDDSSWLSGNAELGYGDSDEATVISYGPNANDKYITAYFRKTITANATQAAFTDLILNARRDDGMVVYINGTEVWRDYMPAGTVNYGTLATAYVPDDGNDWQTKTITNPLVEGTNVIAVEIHQNSNTSSDMSFDFRLYGSTPPNEYIAANASWKYLDNGSNQNTAWRAIAFNDASWSTGNAKLGYGNDGEVTTVSYGSDSNNKYITTYFRKSFTVADASLFGSLSLEAVRDDGMVVYINGTEVWRDGMPTGTINYNTYANHTSSNSDETDWLTTTVGNNLVDGTNVVAVEVHQVNATSSDLGFNFKLSANGIVPAEIVRGPYLQKETPNSITVKWRTNTTTESIVNYGTSLGNLTMNVTDNTGKIDHEVTLTGLNPDTKYYYDIADSDGVYVPEDSGMFVKTAPTVGTDQFVRAWILGDAGTANQNQRNVRDQYYNYVANAATNPDQTDMMLFLGDNAYNDGTDNEYQNAVFNIYGDMLKKAVAWSTLGNHDGHSATTSTQSGPYYDIFSFPTAAEAGGIASGTEAYYSFDYANIHFIVLESNSLSADNTQMAWCTQDIQATTQDWIVAIFHHPPYTKGSHNSDTESQLVNMRNNFLPILEDNGVDLVLNGHSHSYERSFFLNGHYGIANTFDSNTMTVGSNGSLSGKADTSDGAYTKAPTQTEGAVYITTGSAGKTSGGSLNHNAMYASLNQLGSCVMEIGSDGGTGQNLNVKFITDTGAVNDYFTIHKDGTTLSASSETLADDAVKVYPVPANNLLNITVSANENLKSIKVYDAIGKLVKETTQDKVNVSTLKAGLYVVKITTDVHEYFKNIIIKQ
jgi:predicted MPP superfamily phosphohydrolase